MCFATSSRKHETGAAENARRDRTHTVDSRQFMFQRIRVVGTFLHAFRIHALEKIVSRVENDIWPAVPVKLLTYRKLNTR